jgi:hypothetical protein
LTGKSKLVLFESSFESIEKLSAKDNTENLDGQKELVSTGNPTPLIGREPSTRDDAMQMRMMQERLAPSMQDGQKPDLSVGRRLRFAVMKIMDRSGACTQRESSSLRSCR